jgi:disulfide bond formation protein DsbB
MVNSILITLPYLALTSHILLVLLVLAVFFRKSDLRVGNVVSFIGRHALILGFLVSLSAIVGSLFYSEIMGYEACVLCWWQRVFLYPTVILFAVALWKGDKGVYKYIVPLATLAGLIGLYQAYTYMGGASFLACTSAEGACSRIYVKEFGYITIPVMSLTVSLYFFLLAWVNRIYRKETSNE